MCSNKCANPLRAGGARRKPILEYTPTVTTGAVESGAITTLNPFASVVLSIAICNRFTRCPLSPLFLVSLPENSFLIRPTYRRYLVRARALPDDLALHRHAQILWVILEVHPHALAPPYNLHERAAPSTRLVAPASRNSPEPGASGATMPARLRSASSPARQATAWPLPPP